MEDKLDYEDITLMLGIALMSKEAGHHRVQIDVEHLTQVLVLAMENLDGQSDN